MNDSKRNRRVWRQVRILVLLPFITFLWMTGWTLQLIGAQRTPSRTDKKKTTAPFEKKDYETSNVKEASPQQIVA